MTSSERSRVMSSVKTAGDQRSATRVALLSRHGELHKQTISDPCPPWHQLTAHQLAEKLGVTVQALANWRYRGNGPTFRLARKRRCLYRMCDVLEWLTDIPAQKHIRDWLFTHGLIPEDASDEHVEWVTSLYQQPR